jgi:hypothetical protein
MTAAGIPFELPGGGGGLLLEPCPADLVLTPRMRSVAFANGCGNVALMRDHYVAYYRGLAPSDRRYRALLTQWQGPRWDAWALRHAQLGCPCQRKATPADHDRDRAGRAREADARTRSAARRGAAAVGALLEGIGDLPGGAPAARRPLRAAASGDVAPRMTEEAAAQERLEQRRLAEGIGVTSGRR